MVTFLLGNMCYCAAPCCFLGDGSSNSFCFIYPVSLCRLNQMKACSLTHSICLHSVKWDHYWWLWPCAIWIGGPRGQGGGRNFRGGRNNRSVPNAHVRSEIKDVDQVRKEREKKAQRASYLKTKKGKKSYKGGKKGNGKGKGKGRHGWFQLINSFTHDGDLHFASFTHANPEEH